MRDLLSFQTFFEPQYQEYLSDCICGTLGEQTKLAALGEQLRQLAKGGKRIRPFIAYLSYSSTGETEVMKMMPILYAIELYHLFELIHDDIIDKAPTRHGVPCLHTLFGESQAMLGGDLCLSWAMAAITSAPVSTRGVELFMQLSKETIVGEMLDVLSANEVVSEEILDMIIDLKTARYTFVYPILMGLAQAGEDTQTETYGMLGLYLGRAFQRLDNISDVFLGEEVIHKKPCADITQGIATHLTLHLLHHGTKKDIEVIQSYKGKDLTEEDIEAIKKIFIASKAVDTEKKAIVQELNRAEELLKTISMDTECKNTWTDLILKLQSKLKGI